HHSHSVMALELFQQMQEAGVEPNDVTWTVLLGLCARTGMLERGRQLHDRIANSGLKPGSNVQGALINMYSRCGSMDEAHSVIASTDPKMMDTATWNIVILSYGQHGKTEEALSRFEQMQQCGVRPDEIT